MALQLPAASACAARSRDQQRSPTLARSAPTLIALWSWGAERRSRLGNVLHLPQGCDVRNRGEFSAQIGFELSIVRLDLRVNHYVASVELATDGVM